MIDRINRQRNLMHIASRESEASEIEKKKAELALRQYSNQRLKEATMRLNTFKKEMYGSENQPKIREAYHSATNPTPPESPALQQNKNPIKEETKTKDKSEDNHQNQKQEEGLDSSLKSPINQISISKEEEKESQLDQLELSTLQKQQEVKDVPQENTQASPIKDNPDDEEDDEEEEEEAEESEEWEYDEEEGEESIQASAEIPQSFEHITFSKTRPLQSDSQGDKLVHHFTRPSNYTQQTQSEVSNNFFFHNGRIDTMLKNDRNDEGVTEITEVMEVTEVQRIDNSIKPSFQKFDNVERYEEFLDDDLTNFRKKKEETIVVQDEADESSERSDEDQSEKCIEEKGDVIQGRSVFAMDHNIDLSSSEHFAREFARPPSIPLPSFAELNQAMPTIHKFSPSPGSPTGADDDDDVFNPYKNQSFKQLKQKVWPMASQPTPLLPQAREDSRPAPQEPVKRSSTQCAASKPPASQQRCSSVQRQQDEDDEDQLEKITKFGKKLRIRKRQQKETKDQDTIKPAASLANLQSVHLRSQTLLRLKGNRGPNLKQARESVFDANKRQRSSYAELRDQHHPTTMVASKHQHYTPEQRVRSQRGPRQQLSPRSVSSNGSDSRRYRLKELRLSAGAMRVLRKKKKDLLRSCSRQRDRSVGQDHQEMRAGNDSEKGRPSWTAPQSRTAYGQPTELLTETGNQTAGLLVHQYEAHNDGTLKPVKPKKEKPPAAKAGPVYQTAEVKESKPLEAFEEEDDAVIMNLKSPQKSTSDNNDLIVQPESSITNKAKLQEEIEQPEVAVIDNEINENYQNDLNVYNMIKYKEIEHNVTEQQEKINAMKPDSIEEQTNTIQRDQSSAISEQQLNDEPMLLESLLGDDNNEQSEEATSKKLDNSISRTDEAFQSVSPKQQSGSKSEKELEEGKAPIVLDQQEDTKDQGQEEEVDNDKQDSPHDVANSDKIMKDSNDEGSVRAEPDVLNEQQPAAPGGIDTLGEHSKEDKEDEAEPEIHDVDDLDDLVASLDALLANDRHPEEQEEAGDQDFEELSLAEVDQVTKENPDAHAEEQEQEIKNVPKVEDVIEEMGIADIQDKSGMQVWESEKDDYAGSQSGTKLVMEYTEDYVNVNIDHFNTRHSQAQLPPTGHLEETPEPNTFSNLITTYSGAGRPSSVTSGPEHNPYSKTNRKQPFTSSKSISSLSSKPMRMNPKLDGRAKREGRFDAAEKRGKQFMKRLANSSLDSLKMAGPSQDAQQQEDEEMNSEQQTHTSLLHAGPNISDKQSLTTNNVYNFYNYYNIQSINPTNPALPTAQVKQILTSQNQPGLLRQNKRSSMQPSKPKYLSSKQSRKPAAISSKLIKQEQYCLSSANMK